MSTSNKERDLALIQRIIDNRDDVAFTQLYNLYEGHVYRTVYNYVKNKDTAEDLLIEVFTKVFNKLGTFQPTSSFGSWLGVVARNHALDYLRKQRQYFVSLDDENEEGQKVLELEDDRNTPLERLLLKERNKRLKELVACLKPKYKKLIQLRYFDELSYEEIAKEVGAPLGTVKAQLFRARELLRQIVSPNERYL